MSSSSICPIHNIFFISSYNKCISCFILRFTTKLFLLHPLLYISQIGWTNCIDFRQRKCDEAGDYTLYSLGIVRPRSEKYFNLKQEHRKAWKRGMVVTTDININ